MFQNNKSISYQKEDGTIHTGLYNADLLTQENKTLYLGETHNFSNLIRRILNDEITDNIFLIKSPMGSGKSYVIDALSREFSSEDIGIIQMLIYRKSLEDYEKYYNQHLMQDYIYNGGTPDTELVGKVIPILSHQRIKDNNNRAFNSKILLTYTKPFYDVYAEGLITDGLIKRTEENQDWTNRELVINYMTGKVVLVDECDYIVNIIHAFAGSPEFKDSILTKEERTSLLIEAAKAFYEDISQYATALLMFTATTTEEFQEILPVETIKINPYDWLPDSYRIKSVGIKQITFVPYYERKTHGNRLSDTIIHKIIHSDAYDKILMFFPNIQKQDYQSLPRDKRILIIAPDRKLKNGALAEFEEGELEYVPTVLSIVDTEADLQEGQSLDDNTPTLYTTLTDEAIRDYDIILITGSNARAANILTRYDKVAVITEAPLKAEVIQAMGRFRNSDTYVYILERKITNHNDADFRKATTKRYDDYYLNAQTALLSNEYAVKIRNGSLMKRIYDLEFTIDSSMTPTNVNANMDYCYDGFRFSLKQIPKDIKVSYYKKKLTEDKIEGKVIKFLADNKGVKFSNACQLWSEQMPDEKPLTRYLYNKYTTMNLKCSE